MPWASRMSWSVCLCGPVPPSAASASHSPITDSSRPPQINTVITVRQSAGRAAVVLGPLMITPVVTNVMNAARPVRQVCALLRTVSMEWAVSFA